MQLAKQSNSDLVASDKQLNVLYGKVTKKYASNKNFITKLRQAEQAWIQYRDQHVDSVYPEANKNPDLYGSAFSMCQSALFGILTEQRITDLKNLLNASLPKDNNASSAYSKSEDVINNLYKQAVNTPHPDEPSFSVKFREAQQSWVLFHNLDAEAFATLAPVQDHNIVRYSRLHALDELRIKSLNEWVKGIPEGDVCTGSRKVAD